MTANETYSLFNLLAEGARLRDTKFNEREVEDFINKAELELTKERIAPWKNRPQIGYGTNEIRNAELAGLVSGTAIITREHLLLGNGTNSALRGPDLDNADQDDDKFGVYAPLPNECLYILLETATITKDSIVKENIEVLEKNYIQYKDEIRNYHRKPYENLVWSMDWGTYTSSIYSGTSGLFDNSTKEYSNSGIGFNMQGLNYLGKTIIINTNRSRYLIPGKGWKIIEYSVNYIKIPRKIHIDIITPSLQINSEMPAFLHTDIVDKAISIAAASMIPLEQKYQVAINESIKDE